MTDRAADFGDLAMNLHDQIGVVATVDGVLEFAVEALHYDHASVMLMRRQRRKRSPRPIRWSLSPTSCRSTSVRVRACWPSPILQRAGQGHRRR
ncbi:hypothetical protein AB0P21_39070 [Kribbella sp. NPDC056861]|uniref:hypothetical protein n=1 Tax=Kribbella sp. NPDC056861 TaxID=3154857 RepID=UPI00341A80A0